MLLKTNHKHFFLIQAILLSIYLPIFSGGGRFLIQPSTAADCSSCGRSGGTCVYDRSSGSTVCHKHSHVRLLAGAEAPAPFPSPGAKFTLVNNCSETVWAAVLSVPGSPNLESTGFELPVGSSRAIDAPTRWNGRFWGRTNCTFNDSGNATCATGDTVATLAEFGLGVGSADFYDVSLVNGFNLPLRVDPVGGSGRCNSTGCVVDLNRRCPEELRADGGRACRSACNAFNTTVHCCSGTTCRPTLYSQLFKDACPLAFSYATDDATSTFTCSTAANYAIIFCALSIPGQNLTKLDDETDIGLGPSPEPTSPRTSSPETSSPVPIIVAVILCVTGAILAIMIICYCKKRRSSEGSDQVINQDIENLLLQQGSLALKRYKYSEIKKITKSFNEKLGQGGYGSVYKGVLPDGSLVAVKVLIEADSNGEEFINEVASISRTSHVNIVNLLGFCFGRNKRALVYQYMPNKSLDKFITNKDRPLDLETLYSIAVGVAKGLEYLHTGCNTRIVHFDIKPQNILLDEDFCPKISDFGLAKLGKKKQSVISMLGTRGTIGYIAPEVFSRNFGGVSYKSDVYSYGMMVLEMVGRNSIVEVEAFESSTENYFPDKIYEQVVLDVTKRLDGFTFEEELEETANKMLLVGFWCIQTNPTDRPSMSKVVEMLEGSLQSIQIPPKPVLWTPTLPAIDDSSSFSTFVETENSANVVTI